MARQVKVKFSGDHEIYTSIGFSPMGDPTHSIVFNEGADTVAVTNTTIYMGYCDHEIVAKEIHAAMPDKFDAEIIWGDVIAALGDCVCDLDEDKE